MASLVQPIRVVRTLRQHYIRGLLLGILGTTALYVVGLIRDARVDNLSLAACAAAGVIGFILVDRSRDSLRHTRGQVVFTYLTCSLALLSLAVTYETVATIMTPSNFVTASVLIAFSYSMDVVRSGSNSGSATIFAILVGVTMFGDAIAWFTALLGIAMIPTSTRDGIKNAFNVAASVVVAALSYVIFLVVAGDPSEFHLGGLLAFGLSYFIGNLVFVAQVKALGNASADERRDMLRSVLDWPIIVIVGAVFAWVAYSGGIISLIVVLGLYYLVTRSWFATFRARREAGRVWKAVAYALDERAGMRNHSLRVAQLSRMIATEIGGGRELEERAWIAGLLHDLPTLGSRTREFGRETDWGQTMGESPVPEALLDLLYGVDSEVKRAILHHPKRFDEGGYPEGLRAERIPLLARITRAAEFVDLLAREEAERGRRVKRVELVERLIDRVGRELDPEIVVRMVTGDIIERYLEMLRRDRLGHGGPPADRLDQGFRWIEGLMGWTDSTTGGRWINN